MINKKITVQFTLLTFYLAYLMAGILIVLGQHGYSVQSTIQSSFQSLPHLLTNLPFAVYVLSPAIASYVVLKKHGKVTSFKEWLKLVIHVKIGFSRYLFVVAGLVLYFGIHLAVAGRTENVLPFYLFFSNLPGNLIIGGMEEAGWMTVLQPALEKKYGFGLAAFSFGVIWFFWHLPLFFIPGTSHYAGMIDLGMFAIQIIAFRFFYGAIYRISGKAGVFLCVLGHTMFNAASHVVGILPMTWTGTIIANAAVVLLSLVAVRLFDLKSDRLS